MNSRFLLSTTILSLGLVATAQAQGTKNNVKLDPMVVYGKLTPYFQKTNTSALKGKFSDKKIPFTTNVFGSQVIEDLKADRLEKAFEYIPGFSRSGPIADAFTIRGHSAGLQNLQVNGLPGLTSRFGSPATANIEKVEVIKGPASVLYGSMDPGGLVNVVTKKPENDEFYKATLSGQVFTGYGDAGYSPSIDFNGRLNDSGSGLYRLIAGYENKDSFRDFVKDEEAFYLFPSVSWVPSQEQRLDLQLEYTKEKRAGDNGLFVLNQDINQRADITTYYQEPGDIDTDEGLAVNVSYKDKLNDTLGLNVNWRSVWHEDERDLYESKSVQSDGTLLRRNRHQINKRQYHFGDVSLNIDTDFILKQKWVVGLSGGYEHINYDRLAFDKKGASVRLINPIHTGHILDDDPGSFRTYDFYNLGGYAQGQVFVNDKLNLLLGGRYDTQSGDYNLRYIDKEKSDTQSVDVSALSFNTGVAYEFSKNLSVYASYSESFNPQNVPTFDANNRQLDPERGIQYEVGAKLSLLDNKLNANLALFDLTKENVSEKVDGHRQLIGAVKSQGFETQVQYQPSPNWQFQVGYGYTDAEHSETRIENAIGNVPAFSPRHTASFLSRYNYPEEFLGGLAGVGLGTRYVSSRFTDEESTKRVKLPSYVVADLNFYYELEGMKLSLNVNNIFDEMYFNGGTDDIRVYAGDPRAIFLQFTKYF